MKNAVTMDIMRDIGAAYQYAVLKAVVVEKGFKGNLYRTYRVYVQFIQYLAYCCIK